MPALQDRLERMTSASNATDAAVIKAFAEIPALLDQTPALIARGRFLDCECLLGPIDHPFHVSIRAGTDRRPDAGAGADAVLAIFLSRHRLRPGRSIGSPTPRPGWHDLLALTKRGEAMLEGDLHPFMAHLQYFKDVLALPRHHFAAVPVMSGHIEPMVGRYVHVEIDGEMHRIYFEENGAGIPLVCLHTAGSDGTAMAASARGRGVCEEFPHHRLRHALAWQIQSAGELERRGISAHDRALHRRRSAPSARR